MKSTSMSMNQPVPARPALAPCSGAKTSMSTGLWPPPLASLGAGRGEGEPAAEGGGSRAAAVMVRMRVMASSRVWLVGREHGGPPAGRAFSVNQTACCLVSQAVAMTGSDRDEQLLRALHDQYAGSLWSFVVRLTW